MVTRPLILLPLIQVVRVFGNNICNLTITGIVSGIGMLLGGIIISIWGDFKDKVLTIFSSLIVMAGAIIILSFPKYF